MGKVGSRLGVVKHITLDVFSVLFDWEKSLRPLVVDLLKKQGKESDASPFLLTWRRKQLEYTYVSTMVGKNHVSFSTLTERALQFATKAFKIDGQDKLKRLVDAWEQLEAFPEVNEALTRIKKKYTIAMLSNGDQTMLKRLANRLRVKFDTITSAEMAGAYKPNPKIYLKAVEQIGDDPSRIMHVAGSGMDSIGAKAAGLKVAWVNRQTVPMDTWDYAPDVEVIDLRELAGILQT